MGEIVEFPRNKVPSFSVKAKDYVSVIAVDDIKALASGAASIAEYGEPEKLAQTLALIIMDYIGEGGKC